MGLKNDDLFLVNRDTGTTDGSGNKIYKSYKLEYGDLLDSVQSDTIFSAGYVNNVADVTDATKFTTQPSGKYEDVTKFIFHNSILTAKVGAGEAIQIYNETQTNSATYKAEEDGTTETIGGTAYAVLEVKFEEESEGSPQTYALNDQISVRSIGGGGGGEIIIGPLPPVDPAEGTLWYNADNGLTYIWYVNLGDAEDEGQWVDVRPGGGGSGDVDLSDFIIRQCAEPTLGDYPDLTNGTIWIKVCNDDLSGEAICPNEMYLWCDTGDGSGGSWDPIEGGGGGNTARPIEPSPGDETATPPYAGGNGTEGNPYVLTSNDCFLGGSVYSDQVISFFGQAPGRPVKFEEVSGNTSNGIKFNQPTGTVDEFGQYSFKMRFEDIPETMGAPDSYTGLIKCGDIYWTWTVKVLPVGVKKPSILKIQGSDRVMYDAPTAPLFNTSAGPVSALNPGNLGTLTADATLTATATTVSGTGSNLEATFTTDSSGNLQFISIDNGGTGYKYGDTVSFDLSASGFGGSSAQEMIVYVNPTTGPSAVFEISAYDEINAGGFKEMEWEFCTEPTFSSNVKTAKSSSTATTVSVGNGMEPNTEYYARVRYYGNNQSGGEQIVSAFSDVVRTATGSVIMLRYVLKNYNCRAGDMAVVGIDREDTSKSFDSGTFAISPMSGMRVVMIPSKNFGGDESGIGEQIGNHSTYPPATSGDPPRATVSLQVRNRVEFEVTAIDDITGGISALTETNPSFGINDYYKTIRSGSTSTPAGGKKAPLETNSVSGDGATTYLYQSETNGQTMFHAVGDPGTNYAIGDRVWFDPPSGNTSFATGSKKTPTEPGTANYDDIGELTMDSYWDIYLHILGGRGGKGQKGGSGSPQGSPNYTYWVGDGPKGEESQWTAAGGPGGVKGEGAPNTLYLQGMKGRDRPDQNVQYPCGDCAASGGGGGGWAAGEAGGISSGGSKSGGGGGGGASWVDTTLVTDGFVTPTDYGAVGIDLEVNGVTVASADTSRSTSYQIF